MSVSFSRPESRAFFRALGIRIAALRRQAQMTQVELARELRLSQQTVFAYELGQRRVAVDRLVALLRIFGCSFEELVSLTKTKGSRSQLSLRMKRHVDHLKRLPRTQQRVILRMVEVLAREGGPAADIESSPEAIAQPRARRQAEL